MKNILIKKFTKILKNDNFSKNKQIIETEKLLKVADSFVGKEVIKDKRYKADKAVDEFSKIIGCSSYGEKIKKSDIFKLFTKIEKEIEKKDKEDKIEELLFTIGFEEARDKILEDITEKFFDYTEDNVSFSEKTELKNTDKVKKRKETFFDIIKKILNYKIF